MALKFTEILLTLALNLVHCAQGDDFLSCTGSKLDECPGNQICNVTIHQCECDRGYVLVGGECEPPAPYEPPVHNVTAAVVVVFTLVLVAAGLLLVVKKYNLIELARQKINLRRNNDVMYEDVMIGNDDPPLSP